MDYTALFRKIERFCESGRTMDIDAVMKILANGDLPTTRAVDLFMGRVSRPEGIERVEYYLFNGSRIQRNYSTLFFARRNDWNLVNKAYSNGLIDYIQAYSR